MLTTIAYRILNGRRPLGRGTNQKSLRRVNETAVVRSPIKVLAMNAELKEFQKQLAGVAGAALASVAFIAFVSIPWNLQGHPGEEHRVEGQWHLT